MGQRRSRKRISDYNIMTFFFLCICFHWQNITSAHLLLYCFRLLWMIPCAICKSLFNHLAVLNSAHYVVLLVQGSFRSSQSDHSNQSYWAILSYAKYAIGRKSGGQHLGEEGGGGGGDEIALVALIFCHFLISNHLKFQSFLRYPTIVWDWVFKYQWVKNTVFHDDSKNFG